MLFEVPAWVHNTTGELGVGRIGVVFSRLDFLDYVAVVLIFLPVLQLSLFRADSKIGCVLTQEISATIWKSITGESRILFQMHIYQWRPPRLLLS